MKTALAGIIISLGWTTTALPLCVAQAKVKDEKPPALKEYFVEERGVRVRAMLPEGTTDSWGLDGSYSKHYSKNLEENDNVQRLTIIVPGRKSMLDEGPETLPDKDPDGKFVEEFLEKEAKWRGVKYESIKKVEWNGYVGREAVRKPQMGKGRSGMPTKMPAQKIRMFLVKNTLVSVEITWSDAPPSDETIKKLFDSFKIELAEKVEVLKGNWVLQKVVARGKGEPAPKGPVKFELTPNQMIAIKPDGSRGREVEIRMHGGGVKGAIDLRFERHEWEEGIYKLEGDTLTLCIAGKRSPRPKSVTDTDNTTLIQLKREK